MEVFGPNEVPKKERFKSIKTGPGVFVYDGEAVDTEHIPPVYHVSKRTGRTKISDGQRVVLEPAKLLTKPVKVYKYGALGSAPMEFPEREPVIVTKAAIALKLRTLPNFEELDVDFEEYCAKQGVKAPAKARRGRPPKKASEAKPEGSEETAHD